MGRLRVHIRLKRSKALLWHYVIQGANGEITLTSETFFSKSNADRAAIKASKDLDIPIR